MRNARRPFHGTASMSAEYRYVVENAVATITLDRPERKNPLTFDLYAALLERFQGMGDEPAIKAIVLTGADGNFCSGGDVREIVGPLTEASPEERLRFTQMTGDLVKAMLACPQPILAAVDGACAGAGAILAMASDLRYGTARSRVAFLFARVGLAGCDMGACAILPRIIGYGRAAELFYTARAMEGEEAYRCGFYNALVEPDRLLESVREIAQSLAAGPTRAHALTKKMLQKEWDLPLEAAIDAEAAAQAQCMQSSDFKRAYDAFIQRVPPVFRGD